MEKSWRSHGKVIEKILKLSAYTLKETLMKKLLTKTSFYICNITKLNVFKTKANVR